ncbi:MAG: hypothetical protein ACLS9T_06720 [Streptococcus salivarius]
MDIYLRKNESILLMMASPTSVSILETSLSLGKMVLPALYGERKANLSTIVQTIYRGYLLGTSLLLF